MSAPRTAASALNGETAPGTIYRRGLEEGSLTYQRCATCSGAVFFPRVLCPACGSTDLRWERSAGTGTVYSATVLQPRDREPYCVALVDLDEGFRMMTNVVAMPAHEVRIGMRVRVRVTPGQDGPLPLFAPEGA